MADTHAAVYVSVHNLTRVRYCAPDWPGGTEWLDLGSPGRYVTVYLSEETKDAIRAVVRQWDYAEISAAHDEACPACRGEGGECVAVDAEAPS